MLFKNNWECNDFYDKMWNKFCFKGYLALICQSPQQQHHNTHTQK